MKALKLILGKLCEALINNKIKIMSGKLQLFLLMERSPIKAIIPLENEKVKFVVKVYPSQRI